MIQLGALLCSTSYRHYVPTAPGSWCNVRPTPTSFLVNGFFFHKLNPDGCLAHYKSQWGIDFEEIFSSVVKPATIRLVLPLTLFANWPIHQLDVKNAFLTVLNRHLMPIQSFCYLHY